MKYMDLQEIEKEYVNIFPKCESFCIELNRQIKHLIDKENLKLAVPIQFRAKSLLSIIAKVNQGRFAIKKTVLELQDLTGLRIITLFKRDALKIIEIINKHFDIIRKYNPEDKLNENEFGYSSIHIICKLKQQWLEIPTLSEFSELLIEIQVRTLSQHSWAEVSNIFQYKNEENVPKPLIRSISRISALLETVDLEFERLLTERELYKSEIKDQTKVPNQILNVDLLQEILNQKLPIHHKNEEDYSGLLTELNTLGYSDSNTLTYLIDKELKKSLKEDSRICEGFKELYSKDPSISGFENYYIVDNDIKRVMEGFFFTHGGLIRDMVSNSLKKPYYKAIEEIKNKNDVN